MAEPFVLGIEIGGTKLQLAVGHGDGRLVAVECLEVDAAKGGEGIRRALQAAFDPMLARLGMSSDRIIAVGIGFGGPVDRRTGCVLTSNQIGGWTGYPIANWARQAFSVERVALENDADTAAFAEARFGAGVGLSPVLYVQVGSGIGGGLIIDDQIYRGSGLGAVEIGHLWISESSRLNDPGQTLEQVASGWSIAQMGRLCLEREFREGWPAGQLHDLCGGDPSQIRAEIVATAARLGDPDACRILTAATTAVGSALAQAATLLAPKRIILGGGVSQVGEEHWLGPIRREVDRRLFPPFRGTFDVVAASLGQLVVVHGALGLARDAARAEVSLR